MCSSVNFIFKQYCYDVGISYFNFLYLFMFTVTVVLRAFQWADITQNCLLELIAWTTQAIMYCIVYSLCLTWACAQPSWVGLPVPQTFYCLSSGSSQMYCETPVPKYKQYCHPKSLLFFVVNLLDYCWIWVVSSLIPCLFQVYSSRKYEFIFRI